MSVSLSFTLLVDAALLFVAANGAYVQLDGLPFNEQDAIEAVAKAAMDINDGEPGWTLRKDAPASLGDSCGDRRTCLDGLDCVGPVIGRRCFPTKCLAGIAREFQEEYDFEAYKSTLFTDAGTVESDFIPDAHQTFEEFQETPMFQNFAASFSAHPMDLEAVQKKMNDCFPKDSIGRQSSPTNYNVYAGIHIEGGLVVQGSFSFFWSLGDSDPLPNAFFRACAGAGVQGGLELSFLLGFAFTDIRNNVVTNAISLDVDAAVGLSGGAALLFGLNGVVFLEFTLGFGIGGGVGVSYCDTIPLDSPPTATPVPSLAPSGTPPCRLASSINITWSIGDMGGGVNGIPAAPTESEVELLFSRTIEFFKATLSNGFDMTFELYTSTEFLDSEAPGVGWNTNFRADVDFSSLPTTDEFELVINTADYVTFVVEQVQTAGPYFAFTSGLDLVSGAVVSPQSTACIPSPSGFPSLAPTPTVMMQTPTLVPLTPTIMGPNPGSPTVVPLRRDLLLEEQGFFDDDDDTEDTD